MKYSYSDHFYSEMEDTSLSSARVVVPIVLDYLSVNSVVDVGCGMGNWLKVFSENGVANIRGFDGACVNQEKMCVPKQVFTPIDLEGDFNIQSRADLVVCLEVAEHLLDKQAHILIKNLVSVAPVVLFSAAIPLQGGSRHVNERWPEYWSEIFKQHGYVPVDCIRRKVWTNKSVSFFYSQNMVFYVSEAKLAGYPKINSEYKNGNHIALPLVHPHLYLYYAKRWRLLVPFLGKIPPSLLHLCKRFLARIKGSSKD